MSYRLCSLVLALTLCGAAGAEINPPEVDAALGLARLHDAEASAKTAQLERARAKGLIAGDSWAPLLGPSPIDVSRYGIRLFLDFGREVVSGSVEMELIAAQPDLTAIEIDAWSGLRILGVTLLEDADFTFDSPVDLDFTHQNDILSFDLPRTLGEGEGLRILVTYGGRAGYRGDGINWDRHGNGQMVAWTMAEPFGARVWWPCNDRPDDKAVVDVTVTAPSVFTVASNGLVESTLDHGDGTTTTSWASRYPVAPYLVVMNVADYVHTEETYVTGQGTTMPVALYAFPEVADQAEEDLAITPQMIETMAELFGEYPFIDEKYGNCTANFGGGMEHQTLTTISADAIGSAWMPWLNVHELGHQWWGDWVTCADWRELWLNEGFATLTEWLWAEHLGASTLQNYLADSDDIGLFLGPVYDNPVPFSGTVYDKGAWVLRMLRHRLGDENFFEGVIAYRQAHAGEAATSEDLRAAFETVSGRDLEQFFQQWVYGENRPRFRYSWEAINGPAVRLVIEQVQQNAGLFEMPLEIRVTTTNGTEDHIIELAAVTDQTIEIALNASPTGIELDPNRWSLFLAAGPNQSDLDLGPGYPGPFDAGLASLNSQTIMTIPLTNVGGSNLTIFGWGFAYSSVPDFTITAPTQLPLTLVPGATIDLEIIFRSTGLGTRDNWLWISSNDPDSGGYTYARVTGQGTFFEGTVLQIPSSVNFGPVPVYGIGNDSFNVTNMGDNTVTLSATVTGEAFSLLTPVPPVSEPGTQHTILLRFSPDTVGDHRGALVLQTNNPNQPTVEITLRGTGSAAPHLLVSPSSLALGIVGQGQSATLQVSNGGTEDLQLQEISIEGTFDLADHDVVPATVAPGAHLDIRVVSTSDLDGVGHGALNIRSNDPSLPWATVPLSAVLVEDPVLDEDRLAIPASASTAGLGGAWWSTDIVLLNTGQTDAAADLMFSPSGPRADTNIDRTVTIPARTQRTLSDVVAALGHEGVGGITVTTSMPEIILTTRTAATTGATTFGQTIGPVRLGDAQAGQTTSVMAGLASGDGFHTNLGLYNLSDHSITVTFEVFDADGTLLGATSLSADGGAFSQDVDALSDFGVSRGAWAIVSSNEASDLFTSYASVVDDLSHDPTFIPSILVDQAENHLVIPTVAAQPGFNGTRWATELTLVNPSDIEVQATLLFHSHNGSSTDSIDRLIPERSGLHVADLLFDIFGTEGAGWLEIQASNGLVAGCRIFNDASDGTFGQFVPAIPIPSEVSGGTLIIPGLRSDNGFRTNLGLTSLSETDTTVEVTVRSEDGVTLGTETVPLAGGAFVQLVKILHLNFDFEGSAWAEIKALDTEAIFTAHASVIDGSTGDPSFISASEEQID